VTSGTRDLTPRVSVIIPNWNGLAHLPVCLAALRAQTHPDLEIIIADNASTDGSQAWLEREHPEARLLVLEENRGFAGACNAGLRAATGELLVLLNNDTEADPNWLAEMAAAFERHPEAGLVASKLLLFDRRDTLHSAGDVFYTNGTPGNRGVWQKDGPEYNLEECVFSACGAAAGYRRAMLDDIGLLDEVFFFSCEDIDLAWRAQLAGWKCLYAPRAVVYHKLAATGGGTTASFYDGRNYLYLLVKDVPRTVWRKYWAAMVGAQMRIGWQALGAALRGGQAARARLRGQWAGLWAIPQLLKKRRAVQAARRAPDEAILATLTARPRTV
jgi:GT2 family glycosyltransferase